MNNRQQLSVLLPMKNNILTDHTKNHKGGSFDLQKGLRKMERFLPKDILTLPKHRYTGIQSTPLEDELDENDQPLPGHEPFNQVDELALQHDICYRDSKSKSDKHDCDQVMLKDLKKIKPRNFRERVDRKIKFRQMYTTNTSFQRKFYTESNYGNYNAQ